MKPDVNTQIIQAYAFGLTMKEVAKLTGTSKATVALAVTRAGIKKPPTRPATSFVGTATRNGSDVGYPPETPAPMPNPPDPDRRTKEDIAAALSLYHSAKDLRKLTMRALEAIAKREGWPIGMTMAMCGLNPESRAVVL